MPLSVGGRRIRAVMRGETRPQRKTCEEKIDKNAPTNEDDSRKKILRYEAPRSREVRGHVEKVRVTVSGPTCDPTSPEGNNKLWRCGFCVAVG